MADSNMDALRDMHIENQMQSLVKANVSVEELQKAVKIHLAIKEIETVAEAGNMIDWYRQHKRMLSRQKTTP